MLFIIFGANSRFKTIETGEFFCPHENATRRYERKKAALWVSLYFLPLFPIKQQGEVIECQSCGQVYDVDVLTNPSLYRNRNQPSASTWSVRSSTDPVKLVNSIGQQLAQGTPVEYLVGELTNAGYDHEVAVAMVNQHLGSRSAHCPTCNLTYLSAIKTCKVCGGPLHTK